MTRPGSKISFNRILVIRFSSLGDIVLTTPVLSALRENFPDAQIDFLLKEPYTSLLANHQSKCNTVMLPDSVRENDMDFYRFSKELAEKEYDFIIDLQANFRSLVVSRAIGAPVSKVDKNTLRRLALVKFKIGHDLYPDVKRKFFDTLSRIGIRGNIPPTNLHLIEDEIDKARTKFLGSLSPERKVIAIHPGSKWELKEWGRKKFRNLAKKLDELGFNVVYFESKIKLGSSNIVEVRDTSLRELMAILSICDVFVGNDSGPLHISGALGTPVVGVFGPTHSSLGYAPRNDKAIVVESDLNCRPCTLYGKGKCKFTTQKCMENISVEKVLRAIIKLVEYER